MFNTSNVRIYKAKLDPQGNPVKDASGRLVKDEASAVFVMEKRQGWGLEYPVELRNGEWEYSAFTPDGRFNDKANLKACFECHKAHEPKDYVTSFQRLRDATSRWPGDARAPGRVAREAPVTRPGTASEPDPGW